MKVQSRLLLAALPLAAALAVLGFVSLGTVDTLGLATRSILQDNYGSVLAAEQMKEAAERIDSAAMFRALGRAAKADAQATPNLERFAAQLAVQEHNVTEAGEDEATKELRARWNEYRAKVEEFGGLAPGPAATQRYFGELEPAFLRVKEAADRVLEINQDAMVRKSDHAISVASWYRSVIVLSTILALGVGLLASITLAGRALRPLSTLSMAVRRIGEGDLAARARIPGEDEIAQVGRELDQMADKLQEYRSSSLGELLQAQQSSQAAIDSLPDPVLVIGVDGRVLNVNQAAETLLQLSAGVDPLSRAPAEVREAVDRVRQHVVSGKGPYSPKGLDEAVRVRADGGQRALLPRATPLYSEAGGVAGATIVLQDVTRLLRFDELKNDLVATVAHEFRTPLTSLRMAIHVLLEGLTGPLNERQAEMLHAARDDCERLQNIVEDLLDLSRIEAGKVEVSLTPLSAKALADAAVAANEDAARARGLHLDETLLEPILPVLVDPERIALVFDNLIGNAIRHSPPGARIEVRVLPDGQAVRFEVRDGGPGIPAEYRDRIFEKFFRVPGTKGEGVGLGLYISREIVLAHGGDVGVETAPDHGSVFWFTLRVPASAA